MLKVNIGIKLTHPDAKIPTYATPQAAGCDFYSLENLVIQPGEIKEVRTGVYLEIPAGFYMKIQDRSGYAMKRIFRVAGTIDSDYRGEVSPILNNASNLPYEIKKHDRIAQGLICPVIKAEFNLVECLTKTQREKGRFGSTGI